MLIEVICGQEIGGQPKWFYSGLILAIFARFLRVHSLVIGMIKPDGHNVNGAGTNSGRMAVACPAQHAPVWHPPGNFTPLAPA
jgi:hypothetical protein